MRLRMAEIDSLKSLSEWPVVGPLSPPKLRHHQSVTNSNEPSRAGVDHHPSVRNR